MRKWLWLLTLLIVPALHGQVSNPGVIYVTTAPSGACGPYPPIQVVISTGVPYTCDNGTWGSAGGGGGTGFPITLGSTSVAASSTTTSITGLTSLQNVKYLSAGSDIGAQCNTAVTALSNVGVIVLPNSTNIPMSTTCTNIPPGISIRGYGKLASIVNCTVAGDCFQFLMNPTSVGEIASEVSGFEINGSGASNQVLMHFNGASSYTLHDLQFEPYAGSGNAALCLEFDNSANGLFTERNRSYNVEVERQCTTGVLFNQGSDAQTSFGYNTFEFSGISAGANYVVVFQGNSGQIYGGSLAVTANHVSTNTGGGVINFANNWTTGANQPGELLFVSAEENGSGSGTILNVATSGSVLNFGGYLINGAGGAPALNAVTNITAGSVFSMSRGVPSDNVGNYTMGATANGPGPTAGGGLVLRGSIPDGGQVQMDLIASTGASWAGFQLDSTTLAGGTKYQFVQQSHNFTLFNTTDNTEPLTTVTTPTTFKNLVKTNGVGQFCWEATSQYSNTSSVCDTGLSRTGAATIAFGNGTQANASATLDAAHFITGSGETTVTVTPTVGQAACIKSAGPPVVIGTCSTVVGAGGACTCN